MVIYTRNYGYKKGSQSSIPNVIAFTMIRNFFSDRSYEKMRKEYFIRKLNSSEFNKTIWEHFFYVVFEKNFHIF